MGVRGGSGYKNIQEIELTNSNDWEKEGVGDKLQGSRMGSAADNCLCSRTVNGEKVDWESRAGFKGK